MPFGFDICHKPGNAIPHVDMLSRLSNNTECDTIFEIDNPFSGDSLLSEIKKHALNDSEYQQIVKRIADNKWSNQVDYERRLFKYRWELTVENGVVYKGAKLYIPNQFREHVLLMSHETHQGKLAMQNCIKREFWWPNIILDIIAFLKQCEICAKKRPIRKSLLTTWPASNC